MTVTVNPTQAAGGRVWNGKPAKSKAFKKYLLLNVLLPLGIILLIPVAVLIPILNMGNTTPTVISSTSDELRITDYTRLNPRPSIELVKGWLPTAFNVNPEDITKTILPDIKEGTLGGLILKDGNNIIFTVHEKDGNITVTKE